tara:strand:- start:283 stop:2367 length:2085 start_codon:yes stop_codon:yes gene_type:complete
MKRFKQITADLYDASKSEKLAHDLALISEKGEDICAVDITQLRSKVLRDRHAKMCKPEPKHWSNTKKKLKDTPIQRAAKRAGMKTKARFGLYNEKQHNFKDFLIEDILNEMSIYDSKYPVGTQFSPSSRHIKNLNDKGMPVKDNSVLTKVAQTDGAIQVSLGSSKAVEAWIELDNKVYHVSGSRSQVSVPFIKKTDGGGIKWNANTIETAQCLGVFLDGEDLIARISNPDAAPGDDIKVADEIIKGLSGAHDFDTEGVTGIVKVLSDPKLRNPFDLAQTCLLASGMTSFMKSISGSYENIIHGKINDYYKAERENPQIDKTGSKFPTPDMVVCNKDATTVISELGSKKVIFDETEGICKIENSDTKFILVSLKKAKGDAQLGKIFKAMKDRYGLDSFEDMLKTALNEGWFKDALGKAKGVVSKVWDHLKVAFAKVVGLLTQFTRKSENTMIMRANQNPGKDAVDLFREAGIKVDLNEQLLLEAGNPAPVIAKLGSKDLQKMANNIDKHIKVFKNVAKKSDHVAASGKIRLKVDSKLTPDQRIKLFSNWITIRTLEDMFKGGTITDAKAVAKELVELQKEMFFGATDLPVWKVYGAKAPGDTNTFEYLGSGKQFVKDKLDSINSSQVPLIGVEASNQGGKYYTMYSSFCMGLEENGDLSYSLNRMGTNKGGGQMSYVVEGYTIVDAEFFNKHYYD